MLHNSPPVFDTNMNLWQSRESNYSFLRVSPVHGDTVMTLAQPRENLSPQLKLQISLEFVRLTQNVSNFVRKLERAPVKLDPRVFQPVISEKRATKPEITLYSTRLPRIRAIREEKREREKERRRHHPRNTRVFLSFETRILLHPISIGFFHLVYDFPGTLTDISEQQMLRQGSHVVAESVEKLHATTLHGVIRTMIKRDGI